MVKILRTILVEGVSALNLPNCELVTIRPLHNTATAPYHGNALLPEGYSCIEVKPGNVKEISVVAMNHFLSWSTDDNVWCPGDVLYWYFVGLKTLRYLGSGLFITRVFVNKIVWRYDVPRRPGMEEGPAHWGWGGLSHGTFQFRLEPFQSVSQVFCWDSQSVN